MLLSEWFPTPHWSFVLYCWESKTDQPCFLCKSSTKKMMLNSMLNISKLWWVNSAPTRLTRQIQSLVSFSYSRPTFMGRWLAALKTHKGLPLIFYLLHQCGSRRIEKVIIGLQLLLEKQQQQQFMNYNAHFAWCNDQMRFACLHQHVIWHTKDQATLLRTTSPYLFQQCLGFKFPFHSWAFSTFISSVSSKKSVLT